MSRKHAENQISDSSAKKIMEAKRIMKKAALLSSFVAVVFIAAAALMASDSPIGTWKTIDDETKKEKSIVKIWEKDGVIYATIMKLLQEPDGGKGKLCTKCKGQFKDKPTVGMTFLWGLKKEKDGKTYSGGIIMDPNNGKEYSCKLWREGNKLQVRGFLGFSFVGRTQVWHYVGE